MNDQIKEHSKFIENEIINAKNFEDIDNIFRLHNSMVQHFQKERSVHLLITLFFALYSIIFITLYVITQMIIFFIPSGLCFILLFFYIFHYYSLENGIQKLYDIEKKIFDKYNSLNKIYLER